TMRARGNVPRRMRCQSVTPLQPTSSRTSRRETRRGWPAVSRGGGSVDDEDEGGGALTRGRVGTAGSIERTDEIGQEFSLRWDRALRAMPLASQRNDPKPKRIWEATGYF